MRDKHVMAAFLRYAVVGLVSNASGYAVYLLVTWLGVAPMVAMSLLYFAGAMIGFVGNRKWTFAHQGKVFRSLVRYWITHVLGYALNLTMLYVFASRLGYPHQWVQAVAVFVVAGFLFVMLRLFVFPSVKTVLPS
jgi:putative flippase GtrA